MQYTPLLGLQEPTGTESFTRTAAVTANMTNIDIAMIFMLCMGVPYCAGTITFGTLIRDETNRPQSQTISGPNGLEGSIVWSFNANTITTTVSITAPVAKTAVGTYDRTTRGTEITYS